MYPFKSKAFQAAAVNGVLRYAEAQRIAKRLETAGNSDPVEALAIAQDVFELGRGGEGLPEIPREARRVLGQAVEAMHASSFDAAPGTGKPIFGAKVAKLARVPTDFSLPGVPRYFLPGPFTVTDGLPGSPPKTFPVAFLKVEVPELIVSAVDRGELVYLVPRAYAVQPIFTEAGATAGEFLAVTEVHELSALGRRAGGDGLDN